MDYGTFAQLASSLIVGPVLVQGLVLAASTGPRFLYQRHPLSLVFVLVLQLPHITGLAAPVVPQGVHYPPHGRRDIKPARLPAAPAAPEQEQPQEQLQDEQDND